jgi:hypothetical protein
VQHRETPRNSKVFNSDRPIAVVFLGFLSAAPFDGRKSNRGLAGNQVGLIGGYLAAQCSQAPARPELQTNSIITIQGNAVKKPVPKPALTT